MCRLWLPAALGSSSSIAPCTLVASTMASRLPLRSSAFPTATSLAPVVYTFAVSRKLIPSSMARSMISAESSSPVLPPNIMHPRQISLTFTPVLPRFLYSTIHSFEVVAASFYIPRRHASYDVLVSDPDVDVVYIATPHPIHAGNATLCLEAGKAVLCEKPFSVNAAEAERVVELARERGLFIMEGMWTRFFPLMEEV